MTGLWHHTVRLLWHARNWAVGAKGSHYVYIDGCCCSSCELETRRCMRDSGTDDAK